MCCSETKELIEFSSFQSGLYLRTRASSVAIECGAKIHKQELKSNCYLSAMKPGELHQQNPIPERSASHYQSNPYSRLCLFKNKQAYTVQVTKQNVDSIFMSLEA